MYLVGGHKYRLLMLTGEVIEGTITLAEDDWFYIKVGKRIRQQYYWDVDYGYPMETT